LRVVVAGPTPNSSDWEYRTSAHGAAAIAFSLTVSKPPLPASVTWYRTSLMLTEAYVLIDAPN